MKKSIVFILLFGCSFHKKSNYYTDKSLEGSFSTYHSALGSGSGILFKVSITELLKENYSIDSFYLNGKSYPFNVIRSNSQSYIECNYYKSNSPNSQSVNQQSAGNNEFKVINDSIISSQKFYPSWILVSNKSRKKKIKILAYKEIVPTEKY